MSFLGLDVGTSGCKAVVFNRQGKQIACASREYAIYAERPGWAELDSVAVGDACLSVIQEAARSCNSDRVSSLAISSQGEAFTLLDRDQRVLANAMVSSDNRAADIATSWTQKFGAARLYEKTGHTAHPIFSLFKLLWVRQERPKTWEQIAQIRCFEDYIHYRLGLEPAISYSLAGRTMLFNIREARWDVDILAEAGIREDQLPRFLKPGEAVGTLSSQMAQQLELAPNAKVISGGHDQVCAALGGGAVRTGMAALGSGTVECITVAFAQPVVSPALQTANLCTYYHAAPNLYATLAYNLTGGNLLNWFRKEWASPQKEAVASSGVNIYDSILADMSKEPTGLMVLPYFTGSGTPYFDNTTPAAILGLRLSTTRGEVLRALLEGLCFELGLNLRILKSSGIPVEKLLVTGGGAKNRRWLQLKADVLECPIDVPVVTEAGCLGCAMLACAADLGIKVQDIVTEWVQIRETLWPDARRSAFYQERYATYEATYQALRCLDKTSRTAVT